MSEYRLYRVMRDSEGKHCGNEYLGELVTCKECKLNETDDCPMVYYTPLEDGGFETRWWNRPDDFCSWGEREGE